MRTLEEAIAYEREKAKEQRSRIGTWNEKYSKRCEECAEEHEQRAEWLEELKARREAERISDGKPFDVLLVQRYTKAIDDFTDLLCKAFDETNIKEYGFYPENLVRQVAEQLKVGRENED